ncbi:hypothetical protein [Pseudomonas uvaldensis]|uniref:hypothetical protein n=1 Tax=Pseudomonas uvaldensis TaxID=2878385 RepID=UPI001E2BB66B|nr:hypothetical protein [Pseudomonas uvaldensis]MCE0464861.1 hypothetical protein [Pseudomonas uvaldensis]
MSYSRADYYAEGLSESFDEHGITATPEQIRAVAADVVVWSENISQAFYIPVEDPRDNEVSNLRKLLQRERGKVVCRECKGSGSYVSHGPYHSATGACHKCNGEGRHDP